jgi:hypothetical protein
LQNITPFKDTKIKVALLRDAIRIAEWPDHGGGHVSVLLCGSVIQHTEPLHS